MWFAAPAEAVPVPEDVGPVGREVLVRQQPDARDFAQFPFVRGEFGPPVVLAHGIHRDGATCTRGLPKGNSQRPGAFTPVSRSRSARAAVPARKLAGKQAGGVSGSLSATRPW